MSVNISVATLEDECILHSGRYLNLGNANAAQVLRSLGLWDPEDDLIGSAPPALVIRRISARMEHEEAQYMRYRYAGLLELCADALEQGAPLIAWA